MAEIIAFPDRTELPESFTPPAFERVDDYHCRVLLGNGEYSGKIENVAIWRWLNDNLDRVSVQVIAAISRAEQRRVGR